MKTDTPMSNQKTSSTNVVSKFPQILLHENIENNTPSVDLSDDDKDVEDVELPSFDEAQIVPNSPNMQLLIDIPMCMKYSSSKLPDINIPRKKSSRNRLASSLSQPLDTPQSQSNPTTPNTISSKDNGSNSGHLQLHQLQPSFAGHFTINYTKKQSELMYRVASREEMPDDRRLWEDSGGIHGNPNTLRFGGNLGKNRCNEFSSSYTTMFKDSSLESVQRKRSREEITMKKALERQAKVDEFHRIEQEKRQRRAEERQRRQQRKQMMDIGATAVQTQARGFLARRRIIQMKEAPLHSAAILIQKHHRGGLGRVKYRNEYEKIHGAATCIQNGFRNIRDYKIRLAKARVERKHLIAEKKRRLERRKIENRAASKVQSLQRGISGRKRVVQIRRNREIEIKRAAGEEARRRKELIDQFEKEQLKAAGSRNKKKRKKKGKKKKSKK